MELLDLLDDRWSEYRSGYNRIPYNITPLIRQLLETGPTTQFWDIVWDQLHHQGDLGESSYALVPYLALYLRTAKTLDPMLLAYTAVVELERGRNGNPPIPAEIQESYSWALVELPKQAIERFPAPWDEHQMQYFSALVAAVKGQPILAQAYEDMNVDEARKFLASHFDDESWLQDV